MRGLWLDGGDVRLRSDLPIPVPAAGEARLRITCAGICGTDLQLARGYAGFAGTPGHEMVAVVDAGPDDWLGRRVVADINFGCGRCDVCALKGPRHCANRRVLGIRGAPGALAEWTVAPLANLVAVPDEIEDDLAVFAEPVAAACRVAEQLADAGAPHGASIAVLGAGRLGLLVARLLASRSFDVALWGRSERSLRRARVAGLPAAPAHRLRSGSVDWLVDCTGSPEGLARAFDALRPGGTLLLKSTWAGPTPLDLSPVVVAELNVIGSRCGSIAQGLGELGSGLDPRDLIAGRYALDRADEAFAAAAAPGAGKILVLPARVP